LSAQHTNKVNECNCIRKKCYSFSKQLVTTRAGLKGRGPGQFSLDGPYDVFRDVIVCKVCFRWCATFLFAFSGSRLCACQIHSIVCRLWL